MTHCVIDEKARAEKAERLSRAEQPLVVALAAVGVSVTSVWDLVNASNWYEAAIPTLLDHLERSYPDEIRAGIARALATPQSRWAWPLLRAAYVREPDSTFTKEGMAAALGAVAKEAELDELIGLASDHANGTTRVLLLSALRRSRNPKAKAALEVLRHDPQLAREINSWRQRRAPQKSG